MAIESSHDLCRDDEAFEFKITLENVIPPMSNDSCSSVFREAVGLVKWASVRAHAPSTQLRNLIG